MDTSAGLSSIAALSLGFGMSMSTSRMAPSPALKRPVNPKTTPIMGNQGEIKLQNLMLRVGLVEEDETTPTRQYLSVPKQRRRRRSQSMSPKGSPRGSQNLSPTLLSPERHLFLSNNSVDDTNNVRFKKQSSLGELVTSDRNGNINVNQNNSYSDFSDTESEAEKMVNITNEVDLHIKCSQSEAVSVECATRQPLLRPSHKTEKPSESSTNRCSTSSNEVFGDKLSLTANISISEENISRNGSCQTKRVIFATKSHPYNSKSRSIQRQQTLESECDIDKAKALDCEEVAPDDTQLKECVVNGRLNAELSEEYNSPSSSHV